MEIVLYKSNKTSLNKLTLKCSRKLKISKFWEICVLGVRSEDKTTRVKWGVGAKRRLLREFILRSIIHNIY